MPISRKCLHIYVHTHREKTYLNTIFAESRTNFNFNLWSTHCLCNIDWTFQFVLLFMLFVHSLIHSFNDYF